VNWYTLYDTATGQLIGHTSVLPSNPDPGWTVVDHGPNRQDQTNVWDPGTHTWIPRPPDPPGAVVSMFTLNGTQPVTWTNQPAAKTPVAGSLTRLPLHDAQYARLTTDVGAVGAPGAVLIAQVSLDGTTFVDGPSVAIDALGLQVSSLVAVPAQYRTDVFFRLAGQGGNATADPQLRLTTLQVA
jgi:hypothetical protein